MNCRHKYDDGKLAIEYDSIYEMRTSDMHCEICGKHGTKEELEAETVDTITEYCPCCEQEVTLANTFEVQKCPNCGADILPCCLCEDCKPVGECPLEVKKDGE
jgi:predicted RNA-binding Zn-ribbon protein involved in translation (DUF1610 family)